MRRAFLVVVIIGAAAVGGVNWLRQPTEPAVRFEVVSVTPLPSPMWDDMTDDQRRFIQAKMREVRRAAYRAHSGSLPLGASDNDGGGR